MKRTYKIIKIITSTPFAIIGLCSKYGPCKIIHNSLYIITDSAMKTIKQDIKTIHTTALQISIDRNPRSEILSWIEELQIQDLNYQLLHEMLKTVKM